MTMETSDSKQQADLLQPAVQPVPLLSRRGPPVAYAHMQPHYGQHVHQTGSQCKFHSAAARMM